MKRTLWDRWWRRVHRWAAWFLADEWDDYAPEVPRTLAQFNTRTPTERGQ